jgi:hypothetical protein
MPKGSVLVVRAEPEPRIDPRPRITPDLTTQFDPIHTSGFRIVNFSFGLLFGKSLELDDFLRKK